MTKHHQMTNEECRAFLKETLPFYEHKVARDGTKMKLFNYDNFMRAKGAMRYDGIYWSICALPLFLVLDDKLEQLAKYRRKVAYAKEKETAELAQTI